MNEQYWKTNQLKKFKLAKILKKIWRKWSEIVEKMLGINILGLGFTMLISNTHSNVELAKTIIEGLLHLQNMMQVIVLT